MLHGLFTGKLFPPNATLKEKTVSEFGKFFGKFEESGYHTLYHDDMCYDGMWGIRLNLGFPKNWIDFKKRLKENSIHNTGRYLMVIIRQY